METVTQCLKSRELPSKTGGTPLIIWSIKLSDGRTGESLGKEIPVGTPASEIKIEPNGNYAPKVTWLNAPRKSGGFKPANDPYKDAQIIAQSSLSKAVDLVIAGKIEMKDLMASGQKFFDQVYKMVEPFKTKS